MAFYVPKKTSVYETDIKHDKYVITFAPELIKFILDNKKLTTYRYGTKYDYLKVGDKVSIQDRDSKKIVCRAVIIGKSSMSFEDIPVMTETHESYKDKEHQREVFSGYYAYLDRPITDDDKFLVFNFKLSS